MFSFIEFRLINAEKNDRKITVLQLNITDLAVVNSCKKKKKLSEFYGELDNGGIRLTGPK